MRFNVTSKDNGEESVLVTVNDLHQAFDLAGTYARAAYNSGRRSTVFAVVQMPQGQIIFFCQIQPDIGLHYWSPQGGNPSLPIV